MKQIEITQIGAPQVLCLVEAETPTPKSNEILVKVRATGVNRPDIMQRQGKYPMPEDINPVLGLEIAGEVVSVGSDVTEWSIGDSVCALTEGGGYAEYCVVPASQVLPVPLGYSFEQATCLPETFFTVYANLIQLGGLKEGQTVLIHGGTSGIGTTALSICKALGVAAFATARGKIKALQLVPSALLQLTTVPRTLQTQLNGKPMAQVLM